MVIGEEEYTKFYIIQALFKLMEEYEYEKISITDVTNKAGVGRCTFYRHFKSKNDVIIHFFDYEKKEFQYNQRYYPRCRADYVKTVIDVLNRFKEKKEQLKLIRKAHLEYIYLDYLNENFSETFRKDYPDKNAFIPLGYSGMLFNISMAWLDNDCSEPVEELANNIVDTIYFER